MWLYDIIWMCGETRTKMHMGAFDPIDAALKAAEKIAHYPGMASSPTEARRLILSCTKVDDFPLFVAEK